MSQYPALPKGTFEPGWNDPPKFEYSTTTPAAAAATAAGGPPKTKLNLNKRVAFPLSTEGAAAQPPKVATSAGGLPLPFARVQQQQQPAPLPPSIDNPLETNQNAPPLLPPPTIASSQTTIEPLKSDATVQSSSHGLDVESNEALEYVQQIFANIAGEQSDDPSKMDIISGRLQTMINMWKGDNFSNPFKDRLIRIAKALESNRPQEAGELHRALVIDYGPTTFAWGSAVRQLILMKEQSVQEETTSTITTTNTSNTAAGNPYGGFLIPAPSSSGDDDGQQQQQQQHGQEESIRPVSSGRIQHL